MTIYSIVPDETIFQGMYDERSATYEIWRDGVMMQIRPLNRTQGEIVRIVSPQPHHYLNPAYAPGTIVELGPL